MAIDAYSPCPGGTGKKIKFCCNDLLSDLETLDRMLEGEQFHAALQHIERLEAQRGDRACLLAIKAQVQRVTDKIDDARATVARFLEKYPNNPVALAESAILTAATEGGRPAMELFQRAMSASNGPIPMPLYDAARAVSAALAAEGEVLAARAMSMMRIGMNQRDHEALEILTQLNTHPGIALLLKDEQHPKAPADAPWKAAFDEAMSKIRKARWAESAAQLAVVAEQYPEDPAVWRNLAIVRSWLADRPGAVEALEKYASLDVPLEDAVEALALARFLSEDPLGDHVDVLDLSYPITDADQLQVALASSPQIMLAPIDPRTYVEEGQPPPRSVFLLFDCPMPDAGQPLVAEVIPRMIAAMLLFGRQTDREPQLEVIDVSRTHLEQVKALLAEAGGGQLNQPAEQEVATQVSATWELFLYRWRYPAGASREERRRLHQQYVEQAILERWPQMPLGILDGKPPREAATEEAYRLKVLAAIMVLQYIMEQTGADADLNRLRSQLGLSTLEPIDPRQVDVERLPAVRLERLEADKLSDEQLVQVFRRAVGFNAERLIRKFAQALIERPSLAGREEQLRAYMLLARAAEEPAKAFEYIEQGRRAAEALGQSSAAWDILELSRRIQADHGAEAMRLLEHLQREHMHEPGVAQTVTRLLMDLGVIQPDGTIAAPAAAPSEERPKVAVPGAEAAEPGKLWTPESQAPQAEKKIWVPGMD